ncbi:hypothetical protein AC578_10328 [Pseudocercospora eumusae]|uniref:DUF3752 domain-containing protein n=1 Tax=Pseudocercospora eumusae TaxID=321146 RepID=A0A139HR92_9PEZI|nr:hypothetical protein AC578_10328 [Pseudocercospora eumusae]
MSAVGPDLPPHLLAKRKRKQEEAAQDETTTNAGAKRPKSPEEPEKRRRMMGPAPPPAPLDERPAEPAEPSRDTREADSDDSDDDFGPALPSEGNTGNRDSDDDEESGPQPATEPAVEEKLKRDDWMMMPPKQDDLAARMDPSKQRPKVFNTGKGARGPSSKGDDASSWHETAEQKQKRLQDEMMGIGKPSALDPQPARPSKSAKEEAAHRKIQEHVEKTRGPSLLDQHKQAKGAEVEDDDPSKRAFDREKDMGGSGHISSSQKRQMLNKAAGFSGKFSGGTYL